MDATVKEIAKQTGFSIGTVSKVLNDRPGISPVTQKKIRKIAEELNYFPYCKSRTLGMSKSLQKYIGVLTSPYEYSIRAQIENAIEQVFASYGYHLLKLIFSVQDNKIVDQDLFNKNVINNPDIAGCISVTMGLSDKIVAQLNNNNIPVVIVDKLTDYGKCVYVDNESAIFNATKKLIELGHEHIGLITPEPIGYGYDIWAERIKGYKKAMNEKGDGYNPQYVEYENTFDLELVKMATNNLIKNNPKLTAVIYTSDRMAIAGLKALQERHLNVPADISVIGFDNIEYDDYLTPTLSSIKQPAYEIGEKAAKVLFNAMTKKDFKHEAFCYQTELILRDSIKAIK